MSMVTLKQLAEQLNVSVSTVSKALHDSDEISPETVKRVKALAKHLNYQPNKMAISLKSSKTKSIGVIIPNVLNHFFAKVLYAIEKEASSKGYDIIICISNESFTKELQSLEVLGNGSVDGFIISIAEETQTKGKTDHFNSILQQQLPIVMFDRVANDVDCDKVIIDDFGSVHKATTHLINEGRKKIALFTGIDELSVGKLRSEGYVKALEDSKAYTGKPLIIKYDEEEGFDDYIEEILKSNPDIDGIISADNTSGVIALNKALKLGYKIPGQISIIGFSDDNVLKFTDPKLSTISQHAVDIGKTSVRILIDRINKVSTASKTKVIKTDLILRNTTKV